MPKECYFRADRITICDSKGGFSPISNGDHCFHSPDVNNLFATLRQLIVLWPLPSDLEEVRLGCF